MTTTIANISLTTDSGTYTNPANLPPGWAITSSGDDGILISCLQTASRKGYEVSPSLLMNATGGVASFTIECTSDSYLQPAATLFTSRTIYLKGEANTEKAGCAAYGHGKCNGKSVTAKSKDTGPGYENPWTVTLKFKQSTAWTGSANDWAANVAIPGWYQATSAMALNPVSGGGNQTVAFGKGLANLTYDPYFPVSGWASAEGSTNVRTFLICEAVSGGVSQGFFGADVPSGAADFGFDLSNGTYTLRVSAPGFLRKNQSVSLSSSAPVTGLDFGLEFGDLDGDNYVSQAEVDFIEDHIGTDLSDPAEIMDVEDAYPLLLCDADQDGEITESDFEAAEENVGHYGD